MSQKRGWQVEDGVLFEKDTFDGISQESKTIFVVNW